MSKEDKKSDKGEVKAEVKSAPAANGIADLDQLLGGKSIEIATSAGFYKPEHCRSAPIVGYLIGIRDFPETENPFSALLIRLTHQSLVIDDKDTNTTRVAEVGEFVLLPITHTLMGLREKALNPDIVLKVAIQPFKQTKLGGKKTLWEYKVRQDPTNYPRLQIAPDTVQAPQLAASSEPAVDAVPLPQ